uniref:S-adenosylmethionine-dependent methyltransferase At5g38100 n=1 Tax=Nelumbo nucifera TaxID=4432 RepID=A0A822ZTR5_NELNU|nr:TPA_asm: hypothetical protein HUJ06_018280 [Nelumbo nucifera]
MISTNFSNPLFPNGPTLQPECQVPFMAGCFSRLPSILYTPHTHSIGSLQSHRKWWTKTSPAWNKGRIHCATAPNEVLEAYSAQFSKDIQSFLDARAQEMVSGGLMTIIIPTIPNETPMSQSTFAAWVDFLGSCLLDMAKMGLVSEDKVDSFNLPIYPTSPKQLEALIERNGCFSVEGMETLDRPMNHDAAYKAKLFVSHMRAALDGPIRQHFGPEIVDKLFDRIAEKSAKSSIFINYNELAVDSLVILKRKLD